MKSNTVLRNRYSSLGRKVSTRNIPKPKASKTKHLFRIKKRGKKKSISQRSTGFSFKRTKSNSNVKTNRNLRLPKAIQVSPLKKSLPSNYSKSWVVLNPKDNLLIWGHRHQSIRKIASLTKLMTLHTALDIIEEHNINPSEKYCLISSRTSSIKGTSANLRKNDLISLYDLLFCMMLPSGNDAATAISEHLGAVILNHKEEQTFTSKIFTKAFLSRMNDNTERLRLANTHFGNVHGMDHSLSCSTAIDIAKLLGIAIKRPLFKIIISTESHTFHFVREGERVEKSFSNTHKLISRGCSGKTGVTPQAGPCLITTKTVGDDRYIIVLLNCLSMHKRFIQTKRLFRWVEQNISKINRVPIHKRT